MDIITPRGQETLVHEAKAVRLWNQKFPDFQYCETPKDAPAVVDAVLVKNLLIKGVVETKCRQDLTMEKFQSTYGFETMITNEKLQKGRYMAEGLHVPFLLFIYLVDEDILLYQVVWSPEAGWVPQIKVKETITPSNINRDLMVKRENAFIDMSNAKIIKGNSNGQQSTFI
jgi:hypothetical protein